MSPKSGCWDDMWPKPKSVALLLGYVGIVAGERFVAVGVFRGRWKRYGG